MTDQKKICVFCGSSSAIDQKYLTVAENVGRLLTQAGFDIVYGGAHIGLMGALADSALKHNGQVIGVIPEYLKTQEVAHTGLTDMHVTQDMHERQMKMANLSDGFLVLPGGLGTLAEFFEVVTWKQLALHDKPIAILNVYQFWDSLMEALESMKSERFTGKNAFHSFTELQKTEDIAKFFEGCLQDKRE